MRQELDFDTVYYLAELHLERERETLIFLVVYTPRLLRVVHRGRRLYEGPCVVGRVVGGGGVEYVLHGSWGNDASSVPVRWVTPAEWTSAEKPEETCP